MFREKVVLIGGIDIRDDVEKILNEFGVLQ
jgi:hypothetical protein